jgi:hypothetical protein
VLFRQIFLRKFADLRKLRAFLARKSEIQIRACDSQTGSPVNGASGEFEATANPAKNRAVSSALTASELRVGAALSVSKIVTKATAINLDK